jgi:hypothetical protein
MLIRQLKLNFHAMIADQFVVRLLLGLAAVTLWAQDPGAAMRASIEKQRAAAEIQRASTRKQAESVGAVLMPGEHVNASAPAEDLLPEPEPEHGCDPLSDSELSPLIASAASAAAIDPKLLRAVVDQESAGRPCAVSSKGAKGLMQLMPNTALDLGVDDPFDPKSNIDAGARYLKQLLEKFQGDLPQTLGAYNAGPKTVDQAGGVPKIPETQDYVKSILQKLGITRTDPPSIPPPKPIEN